MSGGLGLGKAGGRKGTEMNGEGKGIEAASRRRKKKISQGQGAYTQGKPLKRSPTNGHYIFRYESRPDYGPVRGPNNWSPVGHLASDTGGPSLYTMCALKTLIAMRTSTIAHCNSAWDHQRPPTNVPGKSFCTRSLSLSLATRFLYIYISLSLLFALFYRPSTRETSSSSFTRISRPLSPLCDLVV